MATGSQSAVPGLGLAAAGWITGELARNANAEPGPDRRNEKAWGGRSRRGRQRSVSPQGLPPPPPPPAGDKSLGASSRRSRPGSGADAARPARAHPPLTRGPAGRRQGARGIFTHRLTLGWGTRSGLGLERITVSSGGSGGVSGHSPGSTPTFLGRSLPGTGTRALPARWSEGESFPEIPRALERRIGPHPASWARWLPSCPLPQPGPGLPLGPYALQKTDPGSTGTSGLLHAQRQKPVSELKPNGRRRRVDRLSSGVGDQPEPERDPPSPKNIAGHRGRRF
ncbi:BLOC-1-related complex subunit 6-like isoform X1 [Nycticebus coucang]|uniref:BLOC-1-related complex subunit 6-like isoform X1 n=1 Tax=Nycticebus coucang TaxID=9470 RepID=UPI00234C0A07|nr:BLOC-1-related complex subunit 6-like isoform X1 [Nycticebus coucang]